MTVEHAVSHCRRPCPQAAELVTRNCEAYEAHMRDVRDYLEERLVVSLGPVRVGQPEVWGSHASSGELRVRVGTAPGSIQDEDGGCLELGPGTLGTTPVRVEARGQKPESGEPPRVPKVGSGQVANLQRGMLGIHWSLVFRWSYGGGSHVFGIFFSY